ncbi:hypothetical protein [Rhodococcus opacus]|uniref:DUF4149 domain-containing protein n=1 Tax=Rhodococcus opacus TaxID=37919 RepID=A0A2S8IR61_RHOOP|nr:hypothetical protein [Rhodococcus opacus]PQP17264.1 hypothetical protein C5613_34650 [Rhodococcus opacus]
MTVAMAVATAVTFVWLGMVLAISFLEAPLKFRAPDVTLRIGLGIGRLVFRALNIVESMLAVVLVIAVVLGEPPTRIVVAVVGVVAILSVQLAAVRPRLTRRSDRVLSGEEAPRSHAHYAYIALEVAKVGALVVTGVLLLTG